MTTKEIINRLLDIAEQIKSTDIEGYRAIMKLIADIVLHEAEKQEV